MSSHPTYVCREHLTVLRQCRCAEPKHAVMQDCPGAERCLAAPLEWDEKSKHAVWRNEPTPGEQDRAEFEKRMP